MRGYPGTGKSTIARAIATALHAPLIDRDIIRQMAVDIFGDLPQVGHFSYELMFALAREQLRLGLSVVVDTPLTYRTTYEQSKELARAFHTSMLVVHCVCPPEVQKRRQHEQCEQRCGVAETVYVECDAAQLLGGAAPADLRRSCAHRRNGAERSKACCKENLRIGCELPWIPTGASSGSAPGGRGRRQAAPPGHRRSGEARRRQRRAPPAPGRPGAARGSPGPGRADRPSAG